MISYWINRQGRNVDLRGKKLKKNVIFNWDWNFLIALYRKRSKLRPALAGHKVESLNQSKKFSKNKN